MPYMIKSKGFTLLEMLLTLMIVTSMFVITLNRISDVDTSWAYFSNEYLYQQVDSLVNKKSNHLSNYPISFNKQGKVNQARTITFNGKNVVIHLGTGYLTYE